MDERKEERLTSDTLVQLRYKGTRRTHACRNISRLGCMISADDLVASTGDELDIELLDGVVVTARVIWARQGHLGLGFKREINPATVRYLGVVDQVTLEDVSLRDRFGRLLPDRIGKVDPERLAARA